MPQFVSSDASLATGVSVAVYMPKNPARGTHRALLQKVVSVMTARGSFLFARAVRVGALVIVLEIAGNEIGV